MRGVLETCADWQGFQLRTAGLSWGLGTRGLVCRTHPARALGGVLKPHVIGAGLDTQTEIKNIVRWAPSSRSAGTIAACHTFFLRRTP